MIKQEKQLMFYIRDSTHSIKCWHRIALYQSKRKQNKTKQEVINVYLIKVERRRVYHDVERKSPVIFFSHGAKTLVYRKVCKTPPCFSTRLPRDGIWWQKKTSKTNWNLTITFSRDIIFLSLAFCCEDGICFRPSIPRRYSIYLFK